MRIERLLVSRRHRLLFAGIAVMAWILVPSENAWAQG